jgi:hypothetical protein
MGFESPGATCCPNVNTIYQKITQSESYALSQRANRYTITGSDDVGECLRGVNLPSQAPNRSHHGPEHYTKELYQLAYCEGTAVLIHMQHENTMKLPGFLF